MFLQGTKLDFPNVSVGTHQHNIIRRHTSQVQPQSEEVNVALNIKDSSAIAEIRVLVILFSL